VFDRDSRYYALEERRFTDADGKEIVYKARRFVPRGGSLPLLVEAQVRDGEHLDHLAHRTLGGPTHYWRICDANDALRPDEIDMTAGNIVPVPSPQGSSS